MKQIKKMEANQFYLIRGASAANSPFFESEEDCQLFLKLADRFLKKYLKITSFQNNRDGWVMLIATRSERKIKRAYRTRRMLSKKCKKECAFDEVWQMLSDQIRIFLSTYVKATNFRTGRTGAKVRSRYERFVFESEEEAMRMQALLEKIYYVQAQANRRYRPSKKLHKIRRRLLKTSIYVSCALLRVPENFRALGMRCLDLGVWVADGVVRQLISRTLKHHFPT